ncbi:unknow (plasmid) [Vibrio campbellii]|nr:unknow [Vibrio campbellii]
MGSKRFRIGLIVISEWLKSIAFTEKTSK